MAAQSDEFKFAIQIEKFTDRIGMSYDLTVARCMTRGTAIQENMFDLVLSFLSGWAHAYSSELVKPEHRAYRFCRMAYVMMEAARRDEVEIQNNETEPSRSGRRRAED